MKRMPSVKILEQAFPTKGKTLRLLLVNDQAVRNHPAAIARDRECYHAPKLCDLRLHALNAKIDGHGIEYAKSKPRSFDYINTGDTYNVTIIRFSDGTYRVSDIGTILERGL